MSDSVREEQVMSHQTTTLGSRQHDGAPLKCSLLETKNVKQKTTNLLIKWLLVVFGLLQVTTNLINLKHNHQTPNEGLASCPSLLYPATCSHFSSLISKTTHVSSFTPSAHNNYDHLGYAAGVSYYGDKCETLRERGVPSLRHNGKSYSSLKPSKSLLAKTLEEPLTVLRSLYTSYAYHIRDALNSGTLFGSGVLLADAAQLTSNSMYQAGHDKEIVVLNSTNFNAELIQNNHPFPHIKLIEYYLPYCGICLRFKQTYLQLSKDIYSWRNVIRSSAIDLGVSNNSPIALSWSINVVPTLRIHPPPEPSLAAKFDEQFSAWSHSKQPNELQKSMYFEYSSANLMVTSLGVTKYTNDSKKDPITDKVALLKQDLLQYIEQFVKNHSSELPKTWPNLRPVTEKSLVDLKRHHPRPDLFLLIESSGDSSQKHALGLEIIMELSSSAARKAVRYVRVTDNRELVEDIIAHKQKEINDPTENQANGTTAELKSLKSLLSEQSNQASHVILVHIDDSYSLGNTANTPSTKFSSVAVINSDDLIADEQHSSNLAEDNDDRHKGRDRRSTDSLVGTNVGQEVRARQRRSGELDNLSSNRKVDLVASFIGRAYLETDEDREFLSALGSFDESPTSVEHKKEAFEKLQATRSRGKKLTSSSNKVEEPEDQRDITKHENSTFKQFFNRLNPSSSNSFFSAAIKLNGEQELDDYEDKLKAIRYIFVQEVPRKSLADKSPAEKVEKLNTLINLAAVIKAYFPLPDLASVQFIDAIHSYLSKQHTLLLASLNGQDRVASNFDLKSLKQVIKNIEAEGKKLPEVGAWKHCKYGGYPCALWRLFHTLTAFEYRKLSQINQLSTGLQNQPSISLEDHLVPSAQPSQQAQAQISEPALRMTPQPLVHQNDPPSPVERLVSPPSTTTSLSLTIATPISSHGHRHGSKTYASEMSELPAPVLLVMRDYIVNYFSCEECARNFRQEAADLSFEKVRQQEPAEFSILWLWETHNRVSKRLSINPETNPPGHPKEWYPTYEQCSKCYKKPPSYLKDTSVELAAIFHESIEWNRNEVLSFLQAEFTKQPMDCNANIFGYPVPYGFNYVIIIGLCSLLLIVLLRCASCYIERQRRHKASMLNGVQYSEELQRS